MNYYFWIILILSCHFIGDFVLQSYYMASNKSKSNKALTLHVLAYGIPFYFISMGYVGGIIWLIINLIFHWITDYITSRITSQYFMQQKYHEFFVVIGIDQLLHYIILIATFTYLWQI